MTAQTAAPEGGTPAEGSTPAEGDTPAESSTPVEGNVPAEGGTHAEGAEGVSPPAAHPDGKKQKQVKRFPWYITLLAIFLTALVTFMSTYSIFYVKKEYEKDMINRRYSELMLYDSAVINQIKTLYEQLYVKEFDSTVFDSPVAIPAYSVLEYDRDYYTSLVANAYIARVGDKYGEYFTPGQYEELMSEYRSETVGIGVIVSYNSERKAIETLYVNSDSPADRAGIKAGDFLIAVDGESIEKTDIDGAAKLISGAEGSRVKITVEREGAPLEFDITREKFVSQTVFARMADDGRTGVIRILQFTTVTPEQFKKAADSLIEQGASRIVYDMRDNPGGLLSSVVSVLSYILPKDTPLIRELDKQNRENIIKCEDEHVINLPAIVLTNGNTASAGELFTIDLRDHASAHIVGEKTYGKGVEQSFLSLLNGGMLKMTTKWYSSSETGNYDGEGITPDIVCEPLEEFENVSLFKLEEKDDVQLKTAIEYFENNTK